MLICVVVDCKSDKGLDFYKLGIAKPCTHLHPAPSTPTHLHTAHSLQHPQRC